MNQPLRTLEDRISERATTHLRQRLSELRRDFVNGIGECGFPSNRTFENGKVIDGKSFGTIVTDLVDQIEEALLPVWVDRETDRILSKIVDEENVAYRRQYLNLGLNESERKKPVKKKRVPPNRKRPRWAGVGHRADSGDGSAVSSILGKSRDLGYNPENYGTYEALGETIDEEGDPPLIDW